MTKINQIAVWLDALILNWLPPPYFRSENLRLVKRLYYYMIIIIIGIYECKPFLQNNRQTDLLMPFVTANY